MPQKIIGVGSNYRNHAKEMGKADPERAAAFPEAAVGAFVTGTGDCAAPGL